MLLFNVLEDGTSTRATANLMGSLGFCSVITTPTRVTASCQSALDNFFVNAGTQIYTAGTISYDISGHCPIHVVCPFYIHEKCLPDTTFSDRCLSRENMQRFRALVLRTDCPLYITKKVLVRHMANSCQFSLVFTIYFFHSKQAK